VALPAALLLAAGCGRAPADLSPRPAAVEPSSGDPAVATPVAIRGEGFRVRATLSLAGSAGDVVDTTYRAWLGGVELQQVLWVGERELQAVVPPGLAVGSHALEIQDPEGRKGGLANAFYAGVPSATPAALAATLSLPASVGPGDFSATMTVTNTGGSAALGVTPGPLALAGGSTATLLLKSAPAGGVALAGGQQATFGWTYAPLSAGTVQLQGSASGTDAGSGGAVTSPTALSNLAAVAQPAAVQLASNPFGDGTAFAQLAALGGQLLVGPRGDGTGAVSMNPDGTGALALAFDFPRDLVAAGTRSSNTWAGAPTFPSIGAAGCAPNSAACGPDNENGRGLFTSGTIAAAEWLAVGGSLGSGQYAYLYLAPAAASPVAFRYVDLSQVALTQGTGLTAFHVFHDVAYLGIEGVGRPMLLALRSTPGAPGLDAAVGTDVVDLQLDLMPGLGASGTPRNPATYVTVDAIASFADRLYLANNGGFIRTTTAAPGGYQASPGDWSPCTPADAAYAALASATTGKRTDLEPGDRAVPQMAAWNGRLYAARNTTAGPQLWACDPAAGGDPGQCDPGDWSLVAPDGATGLTRLGDPDNARVTLLVATPGHLWMGFDNAVEGIQLYRAASAAPAAAGDFEGDAGCVAGQAGCRGLGGGGLGSPTGNTRIFDARAFTFQGTTHLYLTTGNGTGPVAVFRIQD
jgi:hypothetical protein